MTAYDFERLFQAWMASNTETSLAATSLLANSNCPFNEALHILAAGFAAGYVLGVQTKLEMSVNGQSRVN